MTEQVKNLMQRLGITEEEALQVIEDDKKIDKGEKLFELSAEQKKASKKATQVGTRTTTKSKKTAPKRKKNNTKSLVITELEQFLVQNAQISAKNIEIVSAERQISFKIGENSYSLTLTQHRK